MRRIRNTVFSSAVALTLAFGAGQALASPAGGGAADARACNDESCDGACIARGYSGGVCNPGCTCFGR
ncbi:MAG TPA: hypothetical protein VFQ39_16775 [Longimicrobium sp.]|nr:hypothetical protein [Longimicrobium sp.]